MPLYSYKAYKKGESALTAVIECQDIEAFAKSMAADGYFLSNVRRRSSSYQYMRKKFISCFKTSRKEIIIFSRQLGTMLRSGVPVLEALDVIAGEFPGKKEQKVYKKLGVNISTGVSLSEAMEQMDGFFPASYVSMIRAGECSGRLDEVLEKASVVMEKDMELTEKTRNLMIYPFFVTGACFFVFWFLTAFLLPRFQSILSGLGQELPWPSVLLLHVGKVIGNPIFIIVLAAFLLLAAIFLIWRRSLFDGHVFYIPLYGPLVRAKMTARLSHHFSLLAGCGIDIVESLDILAVLTGNSYYYRKMEMIKESVISGESLAAAFLEHSIFPLPAVAILTAGEKSGKMEESLLQIASYYEREVRLAGERMTSFIQPLTILMLGAVVAFMMFTIFLPLSALLESI